MLRSINSNTGSMLSSYEANPNNNPSPLASTSISEQYSTPSPSQGTAKVILSEEARKISLKLFLDYIYQLNIHLQVHQKLNQN